MAEIRIQGAIGADSHSVVILCDEMFINFFTGRFLVQSFLETSWRVVRVSFFQQFVVQKVVKLCDELFTNFLLGNFVSSVS